MKKVKIPIPKELAKKIESIVKKPRSKFKSIDEFVAAAVKQKIKRAKKR